MAFMNQERKAKIAARLKPILKQYGIKATLAVRHSSTIVLNIQSGPIDFIGSYNRVLAERAGNPNAVDLKYMDVNPYHYKDWFDGAALEFLAAAFAALNLDGDPDANFDKSDIQSDYFFVGWYVDVNVGRYDKPYVLIQKEAA